MGRKGAGRGVGRSRRSGGAHVGPGGLPGGCRAWHVDGGLVCEPSAVKRWAHSTELNGRTHARCRGMRPTCAHGRARASKHLAYTLKMTRRSALRDAKSALTRKSHMRHKISAVKYDPRPYRFTWQAVPWPLGRSQPPPLPNSPIHPGQSTVPGALPPECAPIPRHIPWLYSRRPPQAPAHSGHCQSPSGTKLRGGVRQNV